MSPISNTTLTDVVKRIRPYFAQHSLRRRTSLVHKPFVLGISGTQGSGKTTWAKALARFLAAQLGLKVITLSLDDLYFDHANLVRVRDADPANKLFRTRGHAGTHDEELGRTFFEALRDEGTRDILVPAFDKSAYEGEGDRVPVDDWRRVTRQPKVDVVIFEGWCVGFRPLSEALLEQKWKRAREVREERQAAGSLKEEEARCPTDTLADHELRHLLVLNANLKRYYQTFMGQKHFDFMLHLDSTDLVNVYDWRIGQEHALIQARGTGMTDEQVIQFVAGYMPGYELYLDDFRQVPFFENDPDKERKGQLRLALDKSRNITHVVEVLVLS